MSRTTNLAQMGSRLRVLVRGYWTHPVARRARLRVLGNIVGWQLRARLFPGDHQVPWIGGTRLSVRRGMAGATGDIYYGLAEFHDMALVLHLLRPGDLFVDVGANIGAYSVLAGGVCQAEVVAIEPIRATAERLRANLELNALGPRAEVIEMCIGDAQTVVHMTQTEDTTNRVLAADETSAVVAAVNMTTLDHVLAGKSPVLIKIDAEGYEGNVLRGAREVLASASLLALSVEGNPQKKYAELDDLSLEEWLRRYGFAARAYDGNARTLDIPSPMNQMCNLLFVRDVAECQRRVTAARSIRVLGREV